MQHYVGLDVSVKETSVCIVDKAGKVIREVKVATKPVAILAVLTEEGLAIERIGLEAGPLSQWLYSALAEAGLPVICVETRHMKAALSAQINKSDRNDARGIAQMMRVGLYRPVHVKTLASQKRRMLLTSRQLLQAKALDIENDLRGTLRNFGLKVGMVGTVKFEARIRELVADHPDLAAIVEPLLIARRVLREQLDVLHHQLLEIVRQDEVCRRLMTTPGVGPVVALTFRATVDVPSRFNNSKAVGAALGLTPRRQQSGEIDRMGGISKSGDAMTREMLFEAALVLMTHMYGPAVRCKRKRRLERTVLHQCIRPRVGAHAPDHHGNPRTSDLISGHASKGYVGHQFSDALGRPFLHLFFSLADLGGENNRGAYITFATVPAASRGLGYELHRPDLEVATAMENAPGNASDFVGERNC